MPDILNCRRHSYCRPAARLVVLIWAAIALQLAGCGAQGPNLQSGQLSADSEAGAGNDSFAGIQDDVRATLGPCWAIDPEVPPIIVALDLVVRRDGTVLSATVSDEDRYRTDPSFRAAADRALLAVQNPHCQPLPLPAAAWPSWSEITMVFNPGPMPFGP